MPAGGGRTMPAGWRMFAASLSFSRGFRLMASPHRCKAASRRSRRRAGPHAWAVCEGPIA